MKKILILFMFFIPGKMMAEGWKSKPFAVSVFNNATLLPPASLTAVSNQPMHPGLNVSYEFAGKLKGKHKWYKDANIGYFYHRYVSQSVLLYSKLGYLRYFGKLSVGGSFQAGYMHSFLLTDRAVKQSDGSYESKKGIGKPQFIGGAGAGFG